VFPCGEQVLPLRCNVALGGFAMAGYPYPGQDSQNFVQGSVGARLTAQEEGRTVSGSTAFAGGVLAGYLLGKKIRKDMKNKKKK
jgi:hypothetical protein